MVHFIVRVGMESFAFESSGEAVILPSETIVAPRKRVITNTLMKDPADVLKPKQSWIERMLEANIEETSRGNCRQLDLRHIVPSRIWKHAFTSAAERSTPIHVRDFFCLTEDDIKSVTKLNFYLEFALAIEGVIPLLLKETCGEIESGEHTNVCLRLKRNTIRQFDVNEESLRTLVSRVDTNKIARKVLKIIDTVNIPTLEALTNVDYSSRNSIVLLLPEVAPFLRSRFDKRDCERHFLITIKEYCIRATVRNGESKRKTLSQL